MTRRRVMTGAGDYVPERGGFEHTGSEMPNVVRHLRTEYGSCPLAPRFGNRVASVRKVTPESARLARDACLAALRPLVARGSIWDVEAEALSEGSAIVVTISFSDAAGEQQIDHRVTQG